MSTVVALADPRRPDPRPGVGRVAFGMLRPLATIESQRFARRPSLWIGWALTVYLIATEIGRTGDWPGEIYESLVPMAFAPLLVGTFVAGVRTGARDGADSASGLAPDAPLDDVDRAAARLLALVVPLALTVVTTSAVWLWTRLEGGFWLGEDLRRTDAARHGIAELLQPILLVALLGAIGIAVGRSRRRVVWTVVTSFVLVVTLLAWWAVQGQVIAVVNPVQLAPLRIPLADGVLSSATPSDWLVDHEELIGYHRQLVHQPTIVGHDVYLLGLIGIAGAAIARDRRRTVRAVSGIVVITGVIIQLAASPW